MNLLENDNSLSGAAAPGDLSEAHYKFTVSYDGTLYQGFQRQADAPTIQAEFEKALRKLGWTGTAIHGAGRTDAGVHADAQAVSAKLRWEHPLPSLLAALNANLPADIAVQSVRRVRADFDPRRDAVSRTYRYQVLTHPQRQPLWERTAWRLSSPPDEEKLRGAAKILIGTHDFAAFGSPPQKGGSTVRTVYQSRWTRTSDTTFSYEVEANGFLYRMVRRMVYLQVSAALGQLPLEDLRRAVDDQAELKAGLAPAAGLVLVRVAYPDRVYAYETEKK